MAQKAINQNSTINSNSNITSFNAGKIAKLNETFAKTEQGKVVLKMLTNYAWQYKNWLNKLDNKAYQQNALEQFNALAKEHKVIFSKTEQK